MSEFSDIKHELIVIDDFPFILDEFYDLGWCECW